MIEREIPGIGVELCDAARTSNQALHKIGSASIQWQHSYVAGDKTFCMYSPTAKPQFIDTPT